jgi:hypothetical protein
MDDDDSEQNKKTKRKKGTSNVLQRYVAYVSDVLSPIWVRRFIQIDDGGNWFVLGCRYRFLLYFRMFLVIFFYIIKDNI